MVVDTRTILDHPCFSKPLVSSDMPCVQYTIDGRFDIKDSFLIDEDRIIRIVVSLIHIRSSRISHFLWTQEDGGSYEPEQFVVYPMFCGP